jgi:hypothetical protein
MKRIGVFSILALTALLVLLVSVPSSRVFAGGSSGNEQQINPPAFDFADFFYQEKALTFPYSIRRNQLALDDFGKPVHRRLWEN